MSTKYTPALLIILMCLSFANQIFRNIELDCSTNGVSKGIYSNGVDGSETNDFCWNHEIFLVTKALEPNMRQIVTYPGVSGYDRGKDAVIKQGYYKYIWLLYGILCVIAFLPYFLWKAKAVKTVKPLIDITDSENGSEEDQRLEAVGLNGSFAWFYVSCKILATISSFGQWFFVCGFIGMNFTFYGINVLSHFTDKTDPWPNPMDILFPKMAKCEWSRYGFSGNIEIKSAQCHMPMNNLSQWSFFIYWIWLVVVFSGNLLSLFHLCLHIYPCFRTYRYRKFVAATCKKDVEKLLKNGINKKIII